jgi:hypothetical protein
MKHITVRLPASLFERLDRMRRRRNMDRGCRSQISRSGLVAELVATGVERDEQNRSDLERSAKRRPPDLTPSTSRPSTAATASASAPAGVVQISRPAGAASRADVERIAAAAARFRRAIEAGELQPGDWHAFVRARAPTLTNAAIRGWYHRQRLPSRDPEAAMQMAAVVEAWLHERQSDVDRREPASPELE